jgi:hypothetical protein
MNENHADVLANENLILIAEHLATKDDIKAWASQFVTKEEFRKVTDELQSGMHAIHIDMAELKTKVEGLESRLMVKLGGLMLGLVIAMTTVLGFLISIN